MRRIRAPAIKPRPELRAIRRVPHGGEREDEVMLRADFSTGVNAYGPVPSVAEAVRSADPAAYPDHASVTARRAVAKATGCDLAAIAIGAGTAELLHAVCLAMVRPGDVVLVPEPAFGEYRRAAALAGARVARPGRMSGGATPPERTLDFCRAVYQLRPRLAFLCTPENPSGAHWEHSEVLEVAEACRRAGTLLILDQAYDAFDAHPLGTPALAGHPAVLHLRSLTKDHALAGVRVGLAIGPPFLIYAIERVRPPWAVSSAAQTAVVAAYGADAEPHVRETTGKLRANARALAAACEALGIVTLPSATHYFLARVGDARRVAAVLLRDHAIKVRDATTFGLPDCVRVAARTPEQNAWLVSALADHSIRPLILDRRKLHVRSH